MGIMTRLRAAAARAIAPGYMLRPNISRATGRTGAGLQFLRRVREFGLDEESLARASEANVWAYRCIDLRARAVARMPWRIVNKFSGEPVSEDTPYHRAMQYAAYRFRQDLHYQMMFGLLVWGENYEEKMYIGNTGIPGGLRWVNPLDIEPYVELGEIRWFDYYSEQGVLKFAPDEIAYKRLVRASDDNRGLSPLMLAMESINIDRQIARYIQSFYRNDASPGGTISPKGDLPLSEDDQERIQTEWAAQHKGVDKAFNWTLLPIPLDIQQIDNKPPEHQDKLTESERRTITAAFNVPMTLVSAGAASDPLGAGNTMAETKAMFYENTVIPDCEDIADFRNNVVMPWIDPSGTHEFAWDLTEIMSLIQHTKERSEMVRGQWRDSVITLNEARRETGYPELGEDGDIFLFPANTVPVGKSDLARVTELLQASSATTPTVSLNGFPLNGSRPGDTPIEIKSEAPEKATTAPSEPPEIKLLHAGRKDSVGTPAASVVMTLDAPEIIAFQNELRSTFDDVEKQRIRWTPEGQHHVTLCYTPLIDADEFEDVYEQVINRVKPVDIRVYQSEIFEQDDLNVLVLNVEMSDELIRFQEEVYMAFDVLGVPMSSYSQPRNWHPHVTLAYIDKAVPVVALSGDTRSSGLTARGDRIVFSRSAYVPHFTIRDTHEPPADVMAKALDDALADLDAYERWILKRAGKAISRPFESEHIPDDIMEEIAAMLDTSTDADAIKAGFALMRDALEGMKSEASYRRGLRAVVRGLWAGHFSLFEFVDNFEVAIRRAYRAEWLVGAAREGIAADDLSEAELNRLADMANDELTYVLPFGRDIVENSREAGGKLAPLLGRVDNWVSRLERVASTAELMAAGDKKKKWVYDPTKEHCPDCERLNGRVYRASTWDRYGIAPRSPELACFGTHCGCDFVDTDDPVTPGRPPKLIGPGAKADHHHIHEEE